MLLERGIEVSYETVRRWTAKFEPQIARNLRRCQRRSGDIWHLDEVVVTISGKSFGSGAPLISAALFWRRSSSPGGTNVPPNGFCAS